jgi:hypothetical protein
MRNTERGRRRVIAAAAAWPLLPVFEALAAGRVEKGVHRVHGDVRVNGEPARTGMDLRAGDLIVTGRLAELLFVTGRDAVLIREGSRVELDGQAGQLLVTGLRVVTGAVLSVFEPEVPKRIRTPTATVGIRGTGVYVESEPGRTYVCTCYGTADLEAAADPQRYRETVTATRHDEPRYIYASGESMMARAPVVNHSDGELRLLEQLVGRTQAQEPRTGYGAGVG